MHGMLSMLNMHARSASICYGMLAGCWVARVARSARSARSVRSARSAKAS